MHRHLMTIKTYDEHLDLTKLTFLSNEEIDAILKRCS